MFPVIYYFFIILIFHFLSSPVCTGYSQFCWKMFFHLMQSGFYVLKSSKISQDCLQIALFTFHHFTVVLVAKVVHTHLSWNISLWWKHLLLIKMNKKILWNCNLNCTSFTSLKRDLDMITILNICHAILSLLPAKVC